MRVEKYYIGKTVKTVNKEELKKAANVLRNFRSICGFFCGFNLGSRSPPFIDFKF